MGSDPIKKHDTVIDELRNVAALYPDLPENLAMAMAVYMLGFNTYVGFGNKLKLEAGKNEDPMLKRIYEYAKKIKEV